MLLADSLIVTVYYLFVLGGLRFVVLGGLLFDFYPWLWDAAGVVLVGVLFMRVVFGGGGGLPRWCEVVGSFCLLFLWLGGGGVG